MKRKNGANELDHTLLYQLQNIQKLLLDEIERCNMIVFIVILNWYFSSQADMEVSNVGT